MKRSIYSTLVIAALAVGFAGCKKDKGETNDEEVITTMVVTLTPQGGGAPLIFDFNDADGPGGAAPTQDEIILSANTIYNVRLQLLNATATPTEDITEEVEEESAAHRFYLLPSAGSNITVSNLNNDDNGVALGTTSTWTTGAAGTGELRIVLRHYPSDPPNKAAADPVDSPKSGTDIEVVFDTTVM